VSLRHRREYAVGLPRGLPAGFEIPAKEFPTPAGWVRTAPGPDPPDFEPVFIIKGRKDAGSSRTPLHHARRARAIWRC
jgi:hypothetical protein